MDCLRGNVAIEVPLFRGVLRGFVEYDSMSRCLTESVDLIPFLGATISITTKKVNCDMNDP